MSDSALVPIEQKRVVFYDDEITAVLVEVDGRRIVYVPVRPICDFLGVQWAAQSKRIKRDAVLSQVLTSVSVMDTQGQQHREPCLVYLWNFSMDGCSASMPPGFGTTRFASGSFVTNLNVIKSWPMLS